MDLKRHVLGPIYIAIALGCFGYVAVLMYESFKIRKPEPGITQSMVRIKYSGDSALWTIVTTEEKTSL